MDKRVLIIDSDVILYKDAVALEKRSIEVVHKSTGRTKTFNNRTEFKDFLKEKSFAYVAEDYYIKDIQTPKNEVSEVYKLIDKHIKDIVDLSWADDVAIYIGTEGATFRENLPLPSKYKGNRTENMIPLYLIEAQHYVRKKHGAICLPGIETDDSVTIRAYEELEKGNVPIIATIDKDAYQSQGVQILDMKDDPMFIHEVPEIGHLRKVKAAIKGDGLLFLAFQTLFGDPVDKYKPSELSTFTYGADSVYSVLKDRTDPKDILETVISEYKRLYPQEFIYMAWNGLEIGANWKFLLNMYWKCSYMKRSMTDQSNFWEYAARYGLNENDY